MPVRFLAVPDPAPSLLAAAASLAPHNPFITASFVASRRSLGERPWLLGLEEDAHLVSGCAAFMRVGYLNRSLDITSLPEIPHSDAFWGGLLQFCGRSRVSELWINSHASTVASIPSLPGERDRRPRCEYVFDLEHGDPWVGITAHHRRNIARARKRGLEIRRVSDGNACESHIQLMRASMQRRHDRGESLPLELCDRELMALIHSGSGELFQAVGGGELLSSMLILRAAAGGYLQTAGTSPDGMMCGASHLLVYSVATILQAEGARLFNLGGAASEQPGLQKFKAGFGTRTIDLEAAGFVLANPLKRILTHAAGRVRRNARALTARLFGHVQRATREQLMRSVLRHSGIGAGIRACKHALNPVFDVRNPN